MSEWVKRTFPNGLDVPLNEMFGRLIVAFFLGCGVAGIYRWTHRRDAEYAPTFVTTLVLMAVLVAVVTQVIGQNSARGVWPARGVGHRPLPDVGPRHPRHGLCGLRGRGRNGDRRRLFADRPGWVRDRGGGRGDHATAVSGRGAIWELKLRIGIGAGPAAPCCAKPSIVISKQPIKPLWRRPPGRRPGPDLSSPPAALHRSERPRRGVEPAGRDRKRVAESAAVGDWMVGNVSVLLSPASVSSPIP